MQRFALDICAQAIKKSAAEEVDEQDEGEDDEGEEDAGEEDDGEEDDEQEQERPPQASLCIATPQFSRRTTSLF